MTSRDKIYLAKLISINPLIDTLLTKLGADTTSNSPDQLHARRVDNQISGWIHEFQKQQPRRIFAYSPFQTNQQINSYLETIYGKKPWKYPLQQTPF